MRCCGPCGVPDNISQLEVAVLAVLASLLVFTNLLDAVSSVECVTISTVSVAVVTSNQPITCRRPHLQTVVNQFLTVLTLHMRYQTPASRGWGQTAQLLHPLAATIEELGPLGGRIEKRRDINETEKTSREDKLTEETPVESDQEEEADGGGASLSNKDVTLLLGLFLVSAGLIVTFLFIPVPNNWLLNHDLVYMGAGVALLGGTTFLGGIIPCICSHFFRKCCKPTASKPKVLETRRVEVREKPAETPGQKEELVKGH